MQSMGDNPDVISMSILKIKKEISKLFNKEANLNNNFSYSDELFLVTDSKGKYINSIIPDWFKSFLRIYTKSGAGIHSPIVKCAIENIKVAHNPLVVFWFGTCELSTKSGKFSDIIRNPYQTIEQLLTEYRQIKGIFFSQTALQKWSFWNVHIFQSYNGISHNAYNVHLEL